MLLLSTRYACDDLSCRQFPVPAGSLRKAGVCHGAQVLGAGQYNGQFAIFDVRQGAAPVDATPIEHSHRCQLSDPAYPRACAHVRACLNILSVALPQPNASHSGSL
jgi:hypothetical protein